MRWRGLDQTEALLVVLALVHEAPRTGGAVLAELHRRLGAGAGLAAGRVFVALDALEAEGLVEVETSDGSACYRPTATGVAALEQRSSAPVLAQLAGGAEAKTGSADASMRQLREVAVLFTDVAASSELFDRHGDAQAHAMLKRHFALLRSAASEHGGDVVKSLGDGLMVVFDGPEPAVTCALAMQRAVAGSADPLELRVGIASGEAVCDEGDYFGRPVIVARRLCDAARPSDVLVADATRRLVPASPEHQLEPAGDLRLKGLSEPVTATAVRSVEAA